MGDLKSNTEHGIIINNRKKMSISGVLDVISFDEQTISLKSELGDLIIKGDNLKVNCFTVETGSLEIEGNINALAYITNNKKGVMSRLFS